MSGIIGQTNEICRPDGAVECGDRSPFSNDATCRVVSKRGHVRAPQNCLANPAAGLAKDAERVAPSPWEE